MIDALFGIGSVCFALALVPAVIRRQPPPTLTCALTAFWLWVFVGCYQGLGYTFSVISGSVTAALWTVLWAQRLRGYPR